MNSIVIVLPKGLILFYFNYFFLLLSKNTNSMIVFPNAKINIGLNITEQRTDGFHNIETIFYPIKLSDILEINSSTNKLIFTNTGISIENGKLTSNLCYKAFEILKKDFTIPDLNIHLHKIIPLGSGLGGGSSNASFTLKSINYLLKLNITEDVLLKYAEQIGSDCPIFIYNKPAYAVEKGNILTPIKLKFNNYYLVLIHPGIHVNTKVAYSKSHPHKPKENLLDLIKLPIEEWEGKIINDFEDFVFENHPEVKEIKEKLYDLGAVYASMSGSGSSVYGIFKSDIEIKNLFGNYFTWKEKL